MEKQEIICNIFNECGGCSLLNIDYQKQLILKNRSLKQLFKKRLDDKIDIQKIIGMKSPYYYRNKGKYVLGTQAGKYVIGLYEEGTHHIINTTDCKLHNEMINEVAAYTFELIQKYKITPYKEDRKKGIIRHLIIRYGIYTNEIMVILVTTNVKISKRDLIINDLIKKFPTIKTIVQNINEKENSAILGEENIKLYGAGFIVDKLKDLKFKISPLSFYQVNPIQTEVLYSKAIEYAGLTGKETVYDLYSGIGTISLFASKYANKVIGIEIVKDAVRDAIENAKLNKIENVKFFAGNVEKILPEIIKKEKRADVIFVDPPRSGLDKNTINTLLKVKAKKIVYISCNPETLVENLKDLKVEYDIIKVQPVDMFPMTGHCEVVTSLSLKSLKINVI